MLCTGSITYLLQKIFLVFVKGIKKYFASVHSIVPAFFHDQLLLQRRQRRAHYWHNDWGHIDQQCVCCLQVQVHRSMCSSHLEVFQNFTGVRLSLSWQYVSLLRPPLVHRSMCGVLCGTGQQQHTYMWAVSSPSKPPAAAVSPHRDQHAAQPRQPRPGPASGPRHQPSTSTRWEQLLITTLVIASIYHSKVASSVPSKGNERECWDYLL